MYICIYKVHVQRLSLIMVSYSESLVRGVSELNVILPLLDGRACNVSHVYMLVIVILVKEAKTICFTRHYVVRKDDSFCCTM